MSTKFLLTWNILICLLIVKNLAGRLDADDYYDDDEQYRFLKRFLSHKSSSAGTSRPPSILENLIRTSSARNPTESLPAWIDKSTHGSGDLTSIGSCSSNPCENGGICVQRTATSFECKCVGPWRGIDCGIADACHRSPCQNGGTCLNVYDDYWCKCRNDYYGNNCQHEYGTVDFTSSLCRPNICNSGRCIPLKTTYYCQCPDGHHGEHCEKRFSKRRLTSADGYYDLWHQLKRTMGKHQTSYLRPPNNEDVAFYDAKNGIYF